MSFETYYWGQNAITLGPFRTGVVFGPIQQEGPRVGGVWKHIIVSVGVGPTCRTAFGAKNSNARPRRI